MHANAQLIQEFYQAFQRRDAAAMAECYTHDIEFSDPVFPRLRGEQVGAMWSMLTSRAEDFSLSFDGVEADTTKGRASWVATYRFSQTGRMVVNRIDATFEFRDGKISRHRDHFDLWKWCRQALGLTGWLFGAFPAIHNKIRAQAAAGLKKFTATANSA
jgi:ketosteroid isomerase-like protein